MNREIKKSTLPEEVAGALESVESYYEGVVDWLARMFDKNTGGFYMATSGANDPSIAPAIEMTAWGVRILETYTNAMQAMPERFKNGIIKFMSDRQDSKTGMFIDVQGEANPRETARNQDAALDIFKLFGEKTPYPHPRDTAKDTTKTTVMPEYMNSVESYISWVSGMNWDNGSWTAGDQTQSSLQYVNMLAPDRREEYKAALFDWLAKRQQENGFWSPNFDFNAVSGAFKVGLVYGLYGMKLPNHEKIIDSIFKCYRVSKTENPFYVRNPISVLNQMARYDSESKRKIQSGIIENVDAVIKSFGEFLCPDGAFSAKNGQSMISFGGVDGSHGLFEGDIDATLMMLIARKTLYAIFDADAPYLEAADFFDKIYS